jgi:hypothetical protein
VPVLARTLEAAGLSTIIVTNMPFWAEKIGTPRTLAVEYPYGHTLGLPGETQSQMRLIHQALEVLDTAKEPGHLVHYPEAWPLPTQAAIQSWQPSQPSPIIRILQPRIREILRERRHRPGT